MPPHGPAGPSEPCRDFTAAQLLIGSWKEEPMHVLRFYMWTSETPSSPTSRPAVLASIFGLSRSQRSVQKTSEPVEVCCMLG